MRSLEGTRISGVWSINDGSVMKSMTEMIRMASETDE